MVLLDPVLKFYMGTLAGARNGKSICLLFTPFLARRTRGAMVRTTASANLVCTRHSHVSVKDKSKSGHPQLNEVAL